MPILPIAIVMWLSATIRRSIERDEPMSAIQEKQPKSGNLRERCVPKHVWRTTAGPTPQGILNRRRRQFVNTLTEENVLRKRSERRTGNLLPLDQQPPPKPRDKSQNPNVRRIRSKKKSRLDADSPQILLERNRFINMWNGIGEMAVKEEVWQEFDRVKPKLLTYKRKYSHLEMYLEDEATLERKRSRSRRRAERERARRMFGDDSTGSGLAPRMQESSAGEQFVVVTEADRTAFSPRTLSQITQGSHPIPHANFESSRRGAVSYETHRGRTTKTD